MILALPLLGFHFAWDQGIYADIADSMLRGGVAYRDGFEHRPPGGFFAYYLAFLIFGRNEWSLRALEVISVGFTGAAMVLVSARRLSSVWPGLLASLFFPLTLLAYGHWYTGEPESFQLSFVVWAMALWPRAEEEGKLGRRCFASGLLLGGAVLIKTTAALLVLFFIGERLWADRKKPSLLPKVRSSLATGLGSAVFPLAVTLYYALRGALHPYLDAVFVFGPNYVARYSSFSPDYHYHQLTSLSSWILPWGGRLLLLLGILRGFWARPRATLWIGLLGLVSLAEVIIQAKYIRYHSQVLLPFLCLGMGMAVLDPGRFREGQAAWLNRTQRVLSWASPLLAGAFLLGWTGKLLDPWADLFRPSDRRVFHADKCLQYYEESARLAKAIRSATGPEDRIFLWANHPLPYFLSDRRMAGPYCLLFHATAPWLGEERVEALIRRLSREEPRLIVVGAGDAFGVPEDSKGLLEVHSQMREFLLERYSRGEGPAPYEFWFRSR